MDKHYNTVHYLYSFHRETTVIIDDVHHIYKHGICVGMVVRIVQD